MTIRILELNHVAIQCSNLEVSIHFYEQILGLQAIPRPAFDFPGAWFALGAQQLHLLGRGDVPSAGSESHHFALKTDDVFEAEKLLVAKGVSEILGPITRPDGVWQLFITDPDGYQIELFSGDPIY